MWEENYDFDIERTNDTVKIYKQRNGTTIRHIDDGEHVQCQIKTRKPEDNIENPIWGYRLAKSQETYISEEE